MAGYDFSRSRGADVRERLCSLARRLDPTWAERFDSLYGYNPARAKELLQEAGYPAGTIHVRLLSYTSPGEAEHPQVVEALAIYFDAVGIQSTIESYDEGKVTSIWRHKEAAGCIWSNIIGLRPNFCAAAIPG